MRNLLDRIGLGDDRLFARQRESNDQQRTTESKLEAAEVQLHAFDCGRITMNDLSFFSSEGRIRRQN